MTGASSAIHLSAASEGHPNARKMTQDALGKRSRIGWRQIQRIENSNEEQITVHGKTLEELAKVLRVGPTVLAGEQPMLDELSRLRLATAKIADAESASEDYEARLIKLDDSYAAVEFTPASNVGSVIARDIPNEAVGRRLTSYTSVRKWLQDAREWAMEDLDDEGLGFATDVLVLLDELDDQLRASTNRTAHTQASAVDAAASHTLDGGEIDQ